ncbi:MAG: hypothetical protein R3F11_03030 [Verrucomicrobiales bacterium]
MSDKESRERMGSQGGTQAKGSKFRAVGEAAGTAEEEGGAGAGLREAVAELSELIGRAMVRLEAIEQRATPAAKPSIGPGAVDQSSLPIRRKNIPGGGEKSATRIELRLPPEGFGPFPEADRGASAEAAEEEAISPRPKRRPGDYLILILPLIAAAILFYVWQSKRDVEDKLRDDGIEAIGHPPSATP